MSSQTHAQEDETRCTPCSFHMLASCLIRRACVFTTHADGGEKECTALGCTLKGSEPNAVHNYENI